MQPPPGSTEPDFAGTDCDGHDRLGRLFLLIIRQAACLLRADLLDALTHTLPTQGRVRRRSSARLALPHRPRVNDRAHRDILSVRHGRRHVAVDRRADCISRICRLSGAIPTATRQAFASLVLRRHATLVMAPATTR
jgi:hypothetical protein